MPRRKNYLLNDVLLEAPKLPDSKQPAHKFACNSTIVQHLVPTVQLSKPRPRPAVGEPKQVSTSADAEDGDAASAKTAAPTTASTTATTTAPTTTTTTTAPKTTTITANVKLNVGRRGMHSATGAFWDSSKDGMWTFKYDGESQYMDIVIMLVWVAYQ